MEYLQFTSTVYHRVDTTYLEGFRFWQEWKWEQRSRFPINFRTNAATICVQASCSFRSRESPKGGLYLDRSLWSHVPGRRVRGNWDALV